MFLGKELMLSLTYGGLSYSRCLIQKHHRGPPVNPWVLAAALSPYSPSPADPWAALFVMAASGPGDKLDSTSEQICYLSTNWFARRIGLLLLYMGSSVTADMLSFKNE
ncbi:uncharacterized protein FOBCDRAFT_204916 [Fusarium oxysporum Fo47]|uniref:uncharacterized protein n=1 Tax=Fusarium oxysporum Fo47 TaxID=660027 RepID=UPI0028699E07|nr:uncharacterized protein FOBCDRAFT_204916 [Fusarium oxysporum Fo47]QKD58079.2 hypothetical protein FOBCDRAFT_204916 [Fusarium oxysporum Fo47]